MREAERAAMEDTERPTAQVRDHLTRYRQLLFQHKQDNISGIYPMKKPEHWRMMIVSMSRYWILLGTILQSRRLTT
jgi:hypothetical protein